MRAGLFGAGRIGKVHGKNLSENPQISEVLITDPYLPAAEELAQQTGGRVGTRDEVLDQAEVLVIASSTDTHAELLIEAARRELPVFCEKPIALDLPTTEKAVAEVERAGIPAQIGFQRRFDQEHIKAQALVAAGEVGKMYLVTSQTHDPEPPSYEYMVKSAGLYKDTFIHDIDAVRFVTSQEIETVFAQGNARIDPQLADIPDHDVGAVTLVLSDGTTGVLTALRHSPFGYDVRLAVFGSRQAIGAGYGPGMALRRLDQDHPPPGTFPGFIERFQAAYRGEMSAFVELAQGNRSTPCSVRDGLEALRVAEAAAISAHTGRPVRVAEMG